MPHATEPHIFSALTAEKSQIRGMAANDFVLKSIEASEFYRRRSQKPHGETRLREIYHFRWGRLFQFGGFGRCDRRIHPARNIRTKRLIIGRTTLTLSGDHFSTSNNFWDASTEKRKAKREKSTALEINPTHHQKVARDFFPY